MAKTHYAPPVCQSTEPCTNCRGCLFFLSLECIISVRVLTSAENSCVCVTEREGPGQRGQTWETTSYITPPGSLGALNPHPDADLTWTAGWGSCSLQGARHKLTTSALSFWVQGDVFRSLVLVRSIVKTPIIQITLMQNRATNPHITEARGRECFSAPWMTRGKRVNDYKN